MGAEALDDVFDEAPAKGSNAGPGLTGVIATLQSLPALVLSRANLPHPLRCSVIEEFAEASLSACEGQIRDMTSDISRIDVHDVLRIYRGKTGAFWVAAARMSAKVACADADAVYQWGRFAEHVGVIRQLYNDRSDLLEGRDEDIRNGTPTIMLAHALSLHREEGRERLLDHVRAAGVDTEARSQVRGMLTSAEVVREHLAYTRALKARGRALLDAIKPTEPYASTLYEMVD
jgi:heptaprenyl diphosphate synthase